MFRSASLFICLIFCQFPMSAFAQEAKRIDNGVQSVDWNPETKTVTIAHKGNVYATIHLPEAESASVFPYPEGIEKFDSTVLNVFKPDAETGVQQGVLLASFHIYDDNQYPFITITRFEHQELFGKDGVIKNLEYPVLETTLAADKVKTLGTAGLREVDKHKGSYMFLAAAQPENRSGIVCGWVTSRDGSGIVFSEKNAQGNTVIRPVIEYGKLRAARNMPADGKWTNFGAETFVLGWFDDCREGLEHYAEQVAYRNQVKMKKPLAGYCTWYADKNGGACNENAIIELAEDAEKLQPFGFNFIQIDDGWQDGVSKNGPRKNFTRVKPDGAYKNGMKPVAEKIAAKGMTAGIWLLPFAGSPEDPHWNPELFVKSGVTDELNDDGKPKRSFKIFANKQGEPYGSRWTGSTLDVTNPDAQEYLKKEIEQIAKDWHYNYFKLDGFNAALGAENIYHTANGEYREDDFGEAVYHEPNITPVGAHRWGLRIIREAAGDDAFLLGCNVSQNMRAMGASFGLVDAMRIGPDNGAAWDSLKRGLWHGTNRYFLNGRVWWNDPDPVYVRDSIPLEHAQLVASWVAVSGQLFAFSDWIANLSEERLNILKRTIRPHGLCSARPVDLFERDFPQIWTLTNETLVTETVPSRSIVAFYNWDDKKPCTVETTAAKLGLPKAERYAAFDFWGNKLFGEWTDKIAVELPAGSCLVLAVRPVEDHPVLLSTSQHITQGIVDVLEEKWNAETKTLSGVSKVIADDPYELRFYDPATKQIRRRMFQPTETTNSWEWKEQF